LFEDGKPRLPDRAEFLDERGVQATLLVLLLGVRRGHAGMMIDEGWVVVALGGARRRVRSHNIAQL
jgi:hypothetical protein